MLGQVGAAGAARSYHAGDGGKLRPLSDTPARFHGPGKTVMNLLKVMRDAAGDWPIASSSLTA